MDTRDPNPGFVAWLQSADNVFWISGKPGSGKSTLMKYAIHYILSRPQLFKQGNNPTVLEFFFYQQGRWQEQSFLGLLHHLLHQFVKTFPYLLEVLARFFDSIQPCLNGRRPVDKQPKQDANNFHWDESSLKEGLRLIGQCANNSGDVCIFIDGFDECEGDHGKHLDFLLKWIETLPKGSFNVKLCIASRPLTAI
jgi:NACHT domain